MKEILIREKEIMFTFQPRLTAKINVDLGDDDLLERQEKYNAIRSNKLLEKQKEKEQKELEGVTFAPAIKSYPFADKPGSPKKGENVFTRLMNVAKEKGKYLNEDVIAEMNRENTFQPNFVTKDKRTISVCILLFVYNIFLLLIEMSAVFDMLVDSSFCGQRRGAWAIFNF